MFSSVLAANLLLVSHLSSPTVVNNTYKNQWQGAVVYSTMNTMGSGVPVSACHVLTNEHVIRGGKSATVKIGKQTFRADVVSLESSNDLALLKIKQCPITHFARLSQVPPQRGDILTLVYYNNDFHLFNNMIKTHGVLRGVSDIVTEENNIMTSMIIDDPHPAKRSSGGGVSSKYGLVSIIFGIASKGAKPTTYAVDYRALRYFFQINGL